MSTLIDLTRKSMGWNNPPHTRAKNQIRNIGIHHTATSTGSQTIFENHWRSLRWRVGGYHEIILRNGDIEICYVPTTVVNGVGGHNTHAYHIGVVGNSSFTPEQERALRERIRFNMNRFQIPVERILGHNEFANTPGFNHRANTCPGRNMNLLRNDLRLPSVANSQQPPESNSPQTHIVSAGETLSGIAQRYRTTVAALTRLNHIPNPNLIRVGQRINLPHVMNESIHVGSRVRVNDNAQSWSTGQAIPMWVRGQTYRVQQIRNNHNELLLANIISWIRRSDVTLV